MRLLSVNVSPPRVLSHEGVARTTGILKAPVPGRVRVGRLGLEGDFQAEKKVHGGPWMAVYVYTEENYRWWREVLGRSDLGAGHFGENLTVEGLPDDEVHIGDVLRAGNARFQVTQPRLPCRTLGMRMQDTAFPERFLRCGRLGFYLRVLEEGVIGAGDPIARVSEGDPEFTVTRVARLRKFDEDDLDGARRARDLEALSPTWKRAFEKRLRRGPAGAPLLRR